MAKALGAKLDDRTCSGADTGDFTTAQHPDVKPQETALAGDPSLVTVGLGGNDEMVFRTLTEQCPALRSQDPTGSPCRDAMRTSGTDKLFQDLAQTRKNLTTVLQTVHRLAPKARVLAVGYPQIIDSARTCSQLPLATGDYAYAEEVSQGLTEAVKAAAAATGSTYVDVYAATQGHDICSADPWINGSTDQQGKALRYHPFAVEQVAVAKAIGKALAGS